MQRLGIIGVGRLGGALARGLAESGRPVQALAGGRDVSMCAAALGVPALDVEQLPASVDLVFLAVPDASVAPLCGSLLFRPGQAVVHVSGALGLCALDAAKSQGALTAVFHPLQSFVRNAGRASFLGVSLGIEAHSQALELELHAIARALGAEPFSLRGVDRPAYHAAAVFASNYVVALHAFAARAFELAGLSSGQARSALAPLTRGTADNIAQAALPDALTGPLARGDADTVLAHLQALTKDPELSAAYRVLGRSLLSLPLSLPDASRQRLAQLLADPPSADDK